MGINILLFAYVRYYKLLGARKHFALVYPALDAEHAERGVGFGEAVVDVCPDGLKGNGTVVVAFAAGYFPDRKSVV